MIRNSSRKTVLARHVVLFRTAWQQGLGLMFSSAKKEHGYVFPLLTTRKVCLHMWFVFSAIDVIYIRKGTVVELVERFTPWTHYCPKQEADVLIELPAGSIKRTRTRVGDRIRI